MSALGWCQEIRVLAEIPLYLRSTVSDCTSICSGRLECTHTPSRSEIISVWMHFIICVGEPPCLCLSAGLPVYPSVCVYVCLILDFCFFSFFALSASLSTCTPSVLVCVCLEAALSLTVCFCPSALSDISVCSMSVFY